AATAEDRQAGSEASEEEWSPSRDHGGARHLKKKSWGDSDQQWVAHDIRDQIIDFVRRWSEKTEIALCRFIEWLKLATSKFYDWKARYGKVNEHNAQIPRDHWLEDWEKEAIS